MIEPSDISWIGDENMMFQLPAYLQFHPDKLADVEDLLSGHLDKYDIVIEEHFNDDGSSAGCTGVARLKGIDWRS